MKGLRAGKASTQEIKDLTGFSESTIWNIDKCETFEDYMVRNIARRKDSIDKQLERAERPDVIQNQSKVDPEQLTVDDVIQISDQEKKDLLIDMVSEIGSTLAQIATTSARILVQLEVLAGGKK